MTQNVLMISTDQKILEEASEVRERMRNYGTIFESLCIMLVSKNKFWEKQNLEKVSDNVIVYPVHYFRAWFFSLPKNINIITAQDPFENGLLGMFLAWRLKAPVQLQIHTDLLSPYFIRESLVNRFRVFLAKRILPKANNVRVVSERIKKSLIEKLNISENKITVLPIFVDVEKIRNAPIVTDLHKKYPDYHKIILMASRLTQEKNIPLAIEAMSEVVKKSPKTLLLIVGEGPEKKNLESLITDYELNENVIIESWTNDLSSYYKTADIFLLTSNYEGYGRTVVESIIASCRVVMSDVGVAREYIEDVTIVPNNKPHLFYEALISSICLEKLEKIGYNMLKKFITKEDYLKLYKESLLLI